MNFGPSYKTLASPTLGKVVYFLGTSTLGPLNEPVIINSTAQAEELFGDWAASPLSKAYLEYSESGGTTAYLVRIIGDYACCNIYGNVEGVRQPVLYFEAESAGNIGNDIVIGVFNSSLRIMWNQDGVQTSKSFEYSSYPNISTLCNAINRNLSDIINASPIVDAYPTSGLKDNNVTYQNLQGGKDRIDATKNELYNALTDTIDILEGQYMDVVVPIGMYVDDVKPVFGDPEYGALYYTADRDYLSLTDSNNHAAGFHKLMIDFCKRQIKLGIFTHCIMGMNTLPEPIPDQWKATVSVAKASPIGTYDGFKSWRGGNWYDYGHYVSIVYGDVYYKKNTIDQFRDNWCLGYVVVWINSTYGESTTGLKLEGLRPYIEFDDETLKGLTVMGVVTYKYSPLVKDYVVTAGVTQASPYNPLYFSANVKIVQRVLSKLHYDIDTFLDSSTEPVLTQSSVNNVLNKSLDERKNTDKIIKSYSYDVTYNKDYEMLTVDLTLYTTYTVEKICLTSNTSLKVG